MTHSSNYGSTRSLTFYTLSCPDCGGPLINHDESGIEYILSFRTPELAELEATDMAEDGDPKPGVIEVEMKIVEPADKKTGV